MNGEQHISLDLDAVVRDLNTQYKFLKKHALGSEPKEGKSTAKAIEFKKAGNVKYQEGQDYEALQLYTKSIAYAAEGSEEQSWVYANRSVVLQRMGQHVSCLHDINRAMMRHCPPGSYKKLRARKSLCLFEMRQAISEDEQQLKQEIKAGATDPEKCEADNTDEWLTHCKFENSMIPNASSKIRIGCDQLWGRHLETTQDIQPGMLG